jgi:hypothetical protein
MGKVWGKVVGADDLIYFRSEMRKLPPRFLGFLNIEPASAA